MSTAPRVATADEPLVIAGAARDAEDAGDLAGARRLVGLLPEDGARRRWMRSLDVGVGRIDDAGRALWLLEPALRHGAVGADRTRLVALAADVLRTRGSAAVAGGVEAAHAAVNDPLLVDAALFDLGMLRRYLDEVLVPRGHQHAGLLASWLDREVSAFEVRSIEPERLVLRDLVSRVESPVMRPDGDCAPAVGDLLYARVLPVPDGARFAVAPVPVDRVTARRVARALVRRAPLAERVRAVASYQRRSGDA